MDTLVEYFKTYLATDDMLRSTFKVKAGIHYSMLYVLSMNIIDRLWYTMILNSHRITQMQLFHIVCIKCVLIDRPIVFILVYICTVHEAFLFYPIIQTISFMVPT